MTKESKNNLTLPSWLFKKCDFQNEDKNTYINDFTVEKLKIILKHIDVKFDSKPKKADLVYLVTRYIKNHSEKNKNTKIKSYDNEILSKSNKLPVTKDILLEKYNEIKLQLDKLLVEILKKRCENQQLKTSGTKAQIVHRLCIDDMKSYFLVDDLREMCTNLDIYKYGKKHNIIERILKNINMELIYNEDENDNENNDMVPYHIDFNSTVGAYVDSKNFAYTNDLKVFGKVEKNKIVNLNKGEVDQITSKLPIVDKIGNLQQKQIDDYVKECEVQNKNEKKEKEECDNEDNKYTNYLIPKLTNIDKSYQILHLNKEIEEKNAKITEDKVFFDFYFQKTQEENLFYKKEISLLKEKLQRECNISSSKEIQYKEEIIIKDKIIQSQKEELIKNNQLIQLKQKEINEKDKIIQSQQKEELVKNNQIIQFKLKEIDEKNKFIQSQKEEIENETILRGKITSSYDSERNKTLELEFKIKYLLQELDNLNEKNKQSQNNSFQKPLSCDSKNENNENKNDDVVYSIDGKKKYKRQEILNEFHSVVEQILKKKEIIKNQVIENIDEKLFNEKMEKSINNVGSSTTY